MKQLPSNKTSLHFHLLAMSKGATFTVTKKSYNIGCGCFLSAKISSLHFVSVRTDVSGEKITAF